MRIKFWTSVRALPTNFRRFLVGVGVFGAGDFSHTLLILAATQLLTGSHGAVTAAQIAALLYALRNVFYTAASYPVGALGDRFAREKGDSPFAGTARRVLRTNGDCPFSRSVAAAAVVGLSARGGRHGRVRHRLSTHTNSIVGSRLIRLGRCVHRRGRSLERALTADLVPDESNRGTAYGVMGTVNGIGDFLSSAVVGLLWSFKPEAGFAYAAVAMFLGPCCCIACDNAMPRQVAVLCGQTTSGLDSCAIAHRGHGLFLPHGRRSCAVRLLFRRTRFVRQSGD